MVARAIAFVVLMAVSCGGAETINPFPTEWSPSWTNYAEDSFYVPGRQEFIELAIAVDERMRASLLSPYNYYRHSRYTYLGMYRSLWDDIPGMFGISVSNGIVVGVTNDFITTAGTIGALEEISARFDTELVWNEIVYKTMEMIPYFIPTNYSDSAVIDFLNMATISDIIIPNAVRVLEDNGVQVSMPNMLPLYNHDMAFKEVGIDYSTVLEPDSNPINRRIVAGLLVEQNIPKLTVAEWTPCRDGTNYTWVQTYKAKEYDYDPWTNMATLSYLIHPERNFIVNAQHQTTNGTVDSAVSLEMDCLVLSTNFLPPEYNRQASAFDNYNYPQLYSTVSTLWSSEWRKISCTTPCVTNIRVLAISNAVFATEPAGSPIVYAGYTNASIYGQSLGSLMETNWVGEWILHGDDHYYGTSHQIPTWKTMCQLRKLLLLMKRVPVRVGFVEYPSHNHTYGTLSASYICSDTQYNDCPEIACGDYDSFECEDFYNTLPMGPWDPATIYTNLDYISYLFPEDETDFRDYQTTKIGDYSRWQLLGQCYSNNPPEYTNHLGLRTHANMYDIDYVAVDVTPEWNNILNDTSIVGTNKISAVKLFYTDPFTSTNHLRDTAMDNLVPDTSLAMYKYADSALPIPVRTRDGYLIYGGISQTNINENVQSYLETVTPDASHDECSDFFPNSKWKGHPSAGAWDVHICLQGYVEFNFDLD